MQPTLLAPARPIRVLLVDDDRTDVELVQRHLRVMPGYPAEVEVASNESEVFKRLESELSFDAVLLDYHLADTTGMLVFQRMRSQGFDIPVILLTDKGNEVLAVRCLQIGMSDYIPKCSANPNSLRRALMNAAEKAHLRKQLEEKQRRIELTLASLRARNDEIQSFYHTLSHELKTPLTASKEFVSILLDGLQGELNADQRESLERVHACCSQMTRLLNDILDATRLETGKLSVDPRKASAIAVADQALANCSTAAARAGVNLVLKAERTVGQAWFDPERILQVLTNLLHNAIKYSARGEEVALILSRKADSRELRVSVQDHGPGIAPEDQPRVFERLYQVKSSDTAIHGGLGIGLYLCREIVRLHGREIELESVPGQGSTFTFHLAIGDKQ